MKNESGFTLVEMLVVLLIISILILITIPNVRQQFSAIDDKGCQALISMVQAQSEAYKIHHSKYPTMEDLINGNYVRENTQCPNGNELTIDTKTGAVVEVKKSGDNG